MNNNNIESDIFSKKIDRTIEKWCSEKGLKKKTLFEQGIISSNGYYQAIINKSLKIVTLNEIAKYFDKSFLDFFIDENNLIAEPEPEYRRKTESELLFELRDEVKELKRALNLIQKKMNQNKML